LGLSNSPVSICVSLRWVHEDVPLNTPPLFRLRERVVWGGRGRLGFSSSDTMTAGCNVPVMPRLTFFDRDAIDPQLLGRIGGRVEQFGDPAVSPVALVVCSVMGRDRFEASSDCSDSMRSLSVATSRVTSDRAGSRARAWCKPYRRYGEEGPRGRGDGTRREKVRGTEAPMPISLDVVPS
jgi:hypothetical protein